MELEAEGKKQETGKKGTFWNRSLVTRPTKLPVGSVVQVEGNERGDDAGSPPGAGRALVTAMLGSKRHQGYLSLGSLQGVTSDPYNLRWRRCAWEPTPPRADAPPPATFESQLLVHHGERL